VLGSAPEPAVRPVWKDLRLDSRVALPISAAAARTDADAYHLAPHRIRRCTFRRMIDVHTKNERVFEVECLYPDRKVPIPLGDLESAMPICNACIAPHIFRPDED